MFRTQSGKVRCFVSASEPQRAGAPAAVCETYADETNGAFPQAPLITWAPGSSGRANIAGVNDRGELRWNHGDIPGANSPQDIVMQYGQTYQLNGWTIFASSAGTQLTNDRNRARHVRQHPERVIALTGSTAFQVRERGLNS